MWMCVPLNYLTSEINGAIEMQYYYYYGNCFIMALMLIVYTLRRMNLMTHLYQTCKLFQHFPLSTLMLEVCQQILIN